MFASGLTTFWLRSLQPGPAGGIATREVGGEPVAVPTVCAAGGLGKVDLEVGGGVGAGGAGSRCGRCCGTTSPGTGRARRELAAAASRWRPREGPQGCRHGSEPPPGAVGGPGGPWAAAVWGEGQWRWANNPTITPPLGPPSGPHGRPRPLIPRPAAPQPAAGPGVRRHVEQGREKGLVFEHAPKGS